MHMLNILCPIVSFYFLCPSFSMSCVFPPCSCSHICISVSLAAIITSYLYLLLFHSIIPSSLFTGQSFPFPPLLSSLSLFNSSLDVNCLLWLSFSIPPYSFLFSPLFPAHACIHPSIRIYTTAGRRQEEGRGDTCKGGEKKRERQERGDHSDHQMMSKNARMQG